jgi:lycopene cyclase domain-containing protein
MLDHPYLYLIIDLFVISVPLLRSFESKIGYYKSFVGLGLSMALTMLLFIPWDAYFTQQGYWGFNDAYLAGPRWLGLPVEEWLFFVVVPFSSLFIYRVFNYFKPQGFSESFTRRIWHFLIAFAVAMAILHQEKAYPLWTFGLLAPVLWLAPRVIGFERLGLLFRAYALVLVPFLMTNGILTGGMTTDPIVWYNDAQNMGIRIWTIPFEDAFYGFLLILLNLMWLVFWQRKNPGLMGTGF